MQERAVVGEPSVNSHRFRREEPREERQLLEMVSEPIGHEDGREVRACQRVAHFEVILTKARWHLPCSAPGRRGIVSEGVVGPAISCDITVVSEAFEKRPEVSNSRGELVWNGTVLVLL